MKCVKVLLALAAAESAWSAESLLSRTREFMAILRVEKDKYEVLRADAKLNCLLVTFSAKI